MSVASDFYDKHKDDKWKILPIPEGLTDPTEICNWIFRSGVGWIELDVKFNIDDWQKESKNAISHLVTHREYDDHKGWKSCCIHGIGIEQTGIWNKYSDVEPEYSWTKLAEDTPIIKKFWEELPFERYARIRFMEVEAGGFVAPHKDFTLTDGLDLLDFILPVNIAISNPENCHMVLENIGVVPWADGKVYMINISHTHSVVNMDNKPRLHMIGHGYPGNKREEFMELLIRSYRKQYESLL